MAYKILYSPEDNKRYPQYTHRKGSGLRKIAIILMLLLGCVWTKYKGVPDFLIPGDKEITVKATHQMLDNIRAGTSIDTAVTTFCKEIIHGAGI